MKKYSDRIRRINEASEQKEAYNALIKLLGKEKGPRIQRIGNNRLAIYTDAEYPTIVKVEGFFKEQLNEAVSEDVVLSIYHDLDTEHPDEKIETVEDSSDKSINESTYPTYKDIDGDTVYKLPVKAKNIEELISLAQKNDELDDFLRGELGSSEGVQTKDGNVFWGSDIQDFLPKRKYEDHIEDRAGQMEFILKNSEQYNKKQLDAMTDEEVKDVYMAVEASMEEMR